MLGPVEEALNEVQGPSALKKAVQRLEEFTREGQDTPFFTEIVLYNLIGKDDARSILARLTALKMAALAEDTSWETVEVLEKSGEHSRQIDSTRYSPEWRVILQRRSLYAKSVKLTTASAHKLLDTMRRFAEHALADSVKARKDGRECKDLIAFQKALYLLAEGWEDR